MNTLEMKYLWNSTNEKLPSVDEEVLGFASSPDLENFGYHVVTYNPKKDSWHEVNGRRSFQNITHWLPIEPPMNILVQIHHNQAEERKKVIRKNSNRRESDRNKDIVIRLMNGQTARKVADLYGISQSRVANIAKRILKKIAPEMNYSIFEMRKLRDLLMNRIDEEL